MRVLWLRRSAWQRNASENTARRPLHMKSGVDDKIRSLHRRRDAAVEHTRRIVRR
jgi:hypothetical protein